MRELATHRTAQDEVPTRKPERARSPASTVLAVQRSAGNAAATRLIQRTVTITDVGQTFTTKAAARAFLLKVHTEGVKKTPAAPTSSTATTATSADTTTATSATDTPAMVVDDTAEMLVDASNEPLTSDGLKRLDEVAGYAAEDRLIEAKLGDVVKYIRGGDAMDYEELLDDPSRSPKREDPPGWDLETTEQNPSDDLDVMQSPRREFPQEDYPRHGFDVAAGLRKQRDALGSDIDARPKEKLGNNQFKYSMRAQLRIDSLAALDRGGKTYYKVTGDPSYRDAGVQSQIYASTKTLPGSSPGSEHYRDYAAKERTELDHLQKQGHDRKHFERASSMYTHKKAVRPDGFFGDPNTKESQIAALFFHSEVQASTHAHEQAGDQLAKALIAGIGAQARASRSAPDEPLRVVVLSVDWTGWSNPNTICSGACKGALIHVAEILEQKFNEYRAAAKKDLNTELLFLRGSQKLGMSGHVGSHQKYSGYGKGARPSSSSASMSSYSNRTVREYPPELMEKPKKEKKTKKRKRDTDTGSKKKARHT